MDKEIPKGAPIVRHWMSNAPEAELIVATNNLRNYLKVAYRIFRRLEAEGYYDATPKEQRHWGERTKR